MKQYLQRIIVQIIFIRSRGKIHTINSPESNYDRETNTFNLEATTINLYKNEILKYIINSDQSTLTNNNKTVELNGNVELISFDQDGETLNANKFKWNIENSVYLLTGDVKFENKNVILSSNKAILIR